MFDFLYFDLNQSEAKSLSLMKLVADCQDELLKLILNHVTNNIPINVQLSCTLTLTSKCHKCDIWTKSLQVQELSH